MQVWINCISTSSSSFSSPSTMLKRAKQHLKCCGCKIREHQTLLLIKSDHVLVQSLIKIEKSSFWSFLHLATEKISNAKDLVWVWLSFPAHSSCWSSFGGLTDPPFASVLVLPLYRGDLKPFLGIYCWWSGGTLPGVGGAGLEWRWGIGFIWSWDRGTNSPPTALGLAQHPRAARGVAAASATSGKWSRGYKYNSNLSEYQLKVQCRMLLKSFLRPLSFWWTLLIITRSSRNEGRNGREERVSDGKNSQGAEEN